MATKRLKFDSLSYKTLFIVVFLLLIGIIGLLRLRQQPPSVTASWFDESYSYRKAITVDNTSGSEITNYQTEIIFDSATLISEGKLQNNCNDIRFTDINGTLLPHLVESLSCNQSSTYAWVKIPSIPTSEATIFMYYGNSSAPAVNPNLLFENDKGISATFYSHSSAHPLNEAGFDTLFQNTTATFGNQVLSQINCANNNCNPLGADDYYATYFEGWIYAPTDGTYTFAVDGDDAQDLIIGGKLTNSNIGGSNVANYYGSHGLANNWSHSGTINLTAGYHSFVYRMEDNGGGDGYRAAWQKPGDPSIDYITQDYFFHRQYQATPPSINLSSIEELSPAPIAYWKFDEGVGSTVYDLAGSNNGLITGATWQTEDACVNGKCLSQDGLSNKYTQVTSNITSGWTADNDFTVNLWFNCKGEGFSAPPYSYLAGLFIHGTSADSGTGGFYLRQNSIDCSNIMFRVSATTVSNTITPNLTSGPNNWAMITAQKEGDTLKVYENGKLVGSQTFAGANWNVNINAQTLIGSVHGRSIKGLIDEVKVYPYARTIDQIKTDYTTGLSGISSSKGSSAILGYSSNNSLSNGLVAYWKMDESSWGTMLDSSGNGYTGIPYDNAGIATGKYGNGGTFDGSGDYVLTNFYPGVSTLGQKFTWSFWKKYNSFAANTGSSGNNSSTTRFYTQIDNVSGGLRAGFGNSFWTATTLGIENIGKWLHITFIFDEGTVYTYVNNELKDTHTGVSFGGDSATPISIGRGFEYIRYLSGQVDEMRIYNRALSPDEVKQLYEFAPDPIAHYTFDSGDNTTLNDISSNSNNGTWYGSSTERYTTGKYGKAGSFNGSDDYARPSGRLDNLIGNNSSFTSSLWIKTDNSQDISLLGTGVSGGHSVSILRLNSNNTLGYYLRNGDNVVVSGDSPIDISKWNYATLVFDKNASTLNLYINGVLKDTKNSSNGLASWSSYQVHIGSNIWASSFFRGSIDDLRIYNYARTPSQIIEDMNAGHPIGGSPVGSMVAHYKFDEGFGTITNNTGNAGIGYSGFFNTSNSAPSWTNNGKNGKALHFTGAEADRVNTNLTYNDNPEYTLTAFIYPINTSVATGFKTIIGTIKGNNIDASLVLGSGNKLCYHDYVTNGDLNYCSTSSPIETNTWQHVALSFKNNNINLYHDGTKVATFGIGKTDTTANLIIGGPSTDSYSGDRYFDGTIDEVKIYTTALTPDQIKIDMNQGKSTVLGSNSSNTGTTASPTSNSALYCIPGDTSPCSPPIAEWKFNENIGATAYDTSGNNNHAVFGTGNSAPTWAVGKEGPGLNFDGQNDYASSNFSPDINTEPFTLSAWAYKTGSNTTRERIVSDYATTYLNWNTDNTISFMRTNSALTYQSATSINTFLPNTWYHVTGVYDGSKIDLYVNGQLQATYPLGASGRSFDNINIGRDTGDWSGFFNGKIDEVRIYNYARSPAQIAYDYNRGAPLAHWKLDECQGTTIYDKSGNNLHGTLSVGASGTQTSPGTCQTNGTAWGNGSAGKLSSSLNFDGSDDYISSNNSTGAINPGIGDFTLSAWIYKPSGGKSAPGIISKNGNPGFRFNINSSNRLLLAIYDGSWHDFLSGANIIEMDKWQQVLVVANRNGNANFFVNGKIASSVNISSMSNVNLSNSSKLLIGDDNWCRTSVCGQYDGQIDDVRIYNYALTSEQVKTLYNNGAVSFQ